MNDKPQLPPMTIPEAMSLSEAKEALDFQQKINIALINEVNSWKREAIQAQAVVRMLIQIQPDQELRIPSKVFDDYKPPEEDLVVAGYPSEDKLMIVFKLEKKPEVAPELKKDKEIE